MAYLNVMLSRTSNNKLITLFISHEFHAEKFSFLWIIITVSHYEARLLVKDGFDRVVRGTFWLWPAATANVVCRHWNLDLHIWEQNTCVKSQADPGV